MGYQVITGMWACDIKESKKLNNKEKENFKETIAEICDNLFKKLDIEILADQFRGDGRLIAIGPRDMSDKLIQFAHDFCECVNKGKEDGSISEKFFIRTYIDISKIQVDDAKNEVLGNTVDKFCTLVDNKFENGIEFSDNTSAFLICTESGFQYLNEEWREKFDQLILDNERLYKIAYQKENLEIHVKASQTHYEQKMLEIIKNELNSNSIKIVDEGDSNIQLMLSDIEDKGSNIYMSIKSSMDKIFRFGKRENWEGICFASLYLDGQLGVSDINDVLNYLGKENNDKFSVFLEWTDICIESFKTSEYFTPDQLSFKKYALTDSMRVYYAKFPQRKNGNTKIIYLDDLSEKCVYLHSFDYGGIKLFQEITPYSDLELHLRQQLEIGLIMCDGIIIHSAEVLRSPVVYKILREYKDFIVDGSIKLLFSSRVNNIRNDFERYIEEKISEYSKSEYGEIEVKSLQIYKNDKTLMKSVIELLLLCPDLVKRKMDGTSNLEELINRDLSESKIDLILRREEYDKMRLLNCNYTLAQLLNAKYIEKEVVYEILSDPVRKKIITTIEQLVSGVVSASILNSVFEKNIPMELRRGDFHKWYCALIHRANFLYAKINTGKFLYMEYLQVRYKNTFLDYSKFLNTFNDQFSVGYYLGADKIKQIRESGDEWNKFKLYYLNSKLLTEYMENIGFDGNQLFNPDIELTKMILKNILD